MIVFSAGENPVSRGSVVVKKNRRSRQLSI